jgi:hypothetical protein
MYKKTPKLNVMFIDNSEAMHKNMKLYFFTYATQYLMHKDKSIVNKFYIPDIEFIVDYFISIEEFLKKKKEKYDLAIIDWNLAPSDSAATIDERGDVVVKKLGNSSAVKVILTGMTHDVIDKESDLNVMTEKFPNTIIKTKTTQTIQDLYEIIVKFFK